MVSTVRTFGAGTVNQTNVLEDLIVQRPLPVKGLALSATTFRPPGMWLREQFFSGDMSGDMSTMYVVDMSVDEKLGKRL
jgi:hypothetical protein